MYVENYISSYLEVSGVCGAGVESGMCAFSAVRERARGGTFYKVISWPMVGRTGSVPASWHRTQETPISRNSRSLEFLPRSDGKLPSVSHRLTLSVLVTHSIIMAIKARRCLTCYIFLQCIPSMYQQSGKSASLVSASDNNNLVRHE